MGKKYIVHKTTIKDDNGVKRRHGEVVELSPKLAKHYNQQGLLRPYTGDDESEDDDDIPPETVVKGTVLAGAVAPEVSNEDELAQKLASHPAKEISKPQEPVAEKISSSKNIHSNLDVDEEDGDPTGRNPPSPTDTAVTETKKSQEIDKSKKK